MAITSLINPPNNFSAHDDLWHIATSDNFNNTDYRYVFDVYVGGSQLIRAKIYPNPANGKGYFNVSNVVSNTMKFDWFNPNGNFISALPDSSGQIFQNYTIKVGEEYNGSVFTNLSTASIKVANCAPNLIGRQTIYSSSYLNENVTQFLTTRDRTNAVGLDEDFFIGFCAKPGENISILVSTLSNSGITNTYTIGNINDNSFQGRRLAQLNIGPKAINKAYGSNIISSKTKQYLVVLKNEDNNAKPDTIFLSIDCKPIFQSANLHFLNNYGFFDTARFNLLSRLTMDIERKTYEQSDYRFNSGSVSFYNLNNDVYGNVDTYKMNESKINFGSKYQWTYKLTMDFPSDIDYNWLDELIMSPQIYAELIINSDYWKDYYPISIKATNYEYSQYINNRLKAFEIEIDMNQKRKGFRR